jgi:hypothetical protein
MEPASTPTILYCHCQYAQVVPKDVKEAVLRKLCDSATPFEAVADLCEMSARKDPALARIAASGAVKIAACYPRAVKWLFAAANAPLPIDRTEVVNMRALPGEAVCEALLHAPLEPNLPAGKVTRSLAESPAAHPDDMPAPDVAPKVDASAV